MKARPWPRAVGLGGPMARLLLASMVVWAGHVSVGRLLLAVQCFLVPLSWHDAGCPLLSAQADLWVFSQPCATGRTLASRLAARRGFADGPGASTAAGAKGIPQERVQQGWPGGMSPQTPHWELDWCCWSKVRLVLVEQSPHGSGSPRWAACIPGGLLPRERGAAAGLGWFSRKEARGEIPEEIAQLMAAVSGPRCEQLLEPWRAGKVAAAGAGECLVLPPERSPA